jgi:uncharacterized integral membrane protein
MPTRLIFPLVVRPNGPSLGPMPTGPQTPDGISTDPGLEPGSAPVSEDSGDATDRSRTPTRLSASWTAVVASVLLLILLVVFIAENTQRSEVNFFGLHGHAPTAVALLIAALAGAGIVIVVAVARILQLRRKAHRESTLR